MTFATGLRCINCGAGQPIGPAFEGCPACRTDGFAAGLTPVYDYAAARAALGDGPLAGPGEGVWRYARLLPLADSEHAVSLGEGGTPLLAMPRLAAELGAAELWVKDESRNPTWSFKDRNAAVAVSVAHAQGAHTVAVATSGNHGASVAAYAARAGLRCVVLTYPGISPAARVLMQSYGADLVVTTHEGRWTILREGVRERGWYPVGNLTDVPTNSPYGHEGYKTIAYELHEQLGGRTPDVVAVPTAYAEGLYGVWKGFTELVALGRARRAPQMVACEPAAGPLLAALDGAGPIARVPARPTVARGVGATVNSYAGVAALVGSDGVAADASEEAIVAAQRDLAREGLFVEPASAVALAGLRSLARRAELPGGLRVVLVATSSGLKNLEPAVAAFGEPPSVEPALAAAEAALAGRAVAGPG